MDLCNARNEAAHLNTITNKRIKEVKKSQKHVMSYIESTKSSYRDDLRVNMNILAESMKSILDSAVKIDPSIFTDYQQMMSETFKPFTDTVSKLQLDISSPAFASIIKRNAEYHSQVTKGLADSINNMIKLDLSGYQEAMHHFGAVGISKTMSTYIKEASELKLDINRIIDEKVDQQDESSTENNNKTNKSSDYDQKNVDTHEKEKRK